MLLQKGCQQSRSDIKQGEIIVLKLKREIREFIELEGKENIRQCEE